LALEMTENHVSFGVACDNNLILSQEDKLLQKIMRPERELPKCAAMTAEADSNIKLESTYIFPRWDLR